MLCENQNQTGIVLADADGNGYITKDEVTTIISLFVKLADPGNQDLPMGDRLKDIVVAFFRIFDSNGNGIIEQFELNEILTDLISGVANILASLVDHLEPYILKVS